MYLIIYSQRHSTIGLVLKEIRIISSIKLSDSLPTWILMTIYTCLFNCVSFSLRLTNSNLKPVNSLIFPAVNLTIYCLPPNTANNWSSHIQSMLTEEVRNGNKSEIRHQDSKKGKGEVDSDHQEPSSGPSYHGSWAPIQFPATSLFFSPPNKD